MHANERLIHDFYDAFSERDGEAMASAYHPDVTFRDPVFPDLDYNGVTAMWKMLTERGDDLEIEFSRVEADDGWGRARWDAWYTFKLTGRKVHNIIDAEFSFRNGKVVRHHDEFDFWRWSKQALGPAGYILGWSPLLQGRVQKTAMTQLNRWRIRHG